MVGGGTYFTIASNKRREIVVLIMQFTHGETIFGAGVDNRKIELLIGGFEFDKQIEHHVEDLVRSRVLAVDLVDDHDRLGFVLERLAQDKAGLCLRSVMCVDHEQNAVDHLHDAFYFTAEIGVTGSIDNVDAVTIPVKRRRSWRGW